MGRKFYKIRKKAANPSICLMSLMSILSFHQGYSAKYKYSSEHYQPCLGRQEQGAECEQPEDEQHEAYILRFPAYLEALFLFRSAVIVISHFHTPSALYAKSRICVRAGVKSDKNPPILYSCIDFAMKSKYNKRGKSILTEKYAKTS